MNNSIIAFLVAISATTFIFAKLQRSTGGNTKSAAIGAGIAGLLILILSIFLLRLLPAN